MIIINNLLISANHDVQILCANTHTLTLRHKGKSACAIIRVYITFHHEGKSYFSARQHCQFDIRILQSHSIFRLQSLPSINNTKNQVSSWHPIGCTTCNAPWDIGQMAWQCRSQENDRVLLKITTLVYFLNKINSNYSNLWNINVMIMVYFCLYDCDTDKQWKKKP